MSLLITDTILRLRNEIHNNVSQVQANRMQCERLSQRIDRLTDSLEHVGEETGPILDNFLQCIDDCNQYIEKLKSDDQWYEEIYEYKKSDATLKELNKLLSQIGQGLCSGLDIQEIFSQKQDQEDQRTDLEDLQQRVDEISQKMLEKQIARHKLIDKNIDKRLQSFRFYLQQNLSIEEDSTKYEDILHIPYKDLYIEENLIGSGGFTNVYKAQWLTHQNPVVVKIMHIKNLLNIENEFYRELSAIYHIRHTNVLHVYGACVEPDFYAIVVQYMRLGSLYDILHKKSEPISFDWCDRYSIAWQMAKSINYLHNLNPSIIHQDIKSMNFLLKYNESSKEKYLVKVCDFGFTEIRREILLQPSALPPIELIGSFYWKAPELFDIPIRHTKHSDVYSLGIVFWELVTGENPWNEYDDPMIILAQVKAGERPVIPLDVPESYQQVIRDSWRQNPEERPSCFELMARLYQQLKQAQSSIEVPDEILPVDLHPQQTQHEKQHSSTSSMTSNDSIPVATQVVREEDEEKCLTNNLKKALVTEPFHTETNIDEQTANLNATESEPTDEQNQEMSSTIQTESEPKLQKTSSLNMKTENSSIVSSPSNTQVEDLTLRSQGGNSTNGYLSSQNSGPMYRVEKRRPLYQKSPWTSS